MIKNSTQQLNTKRPEQDSGLLPQWESESSLCRNQRRVNKLDWNLGSAGRLGHAEPAEPGCLCHVALHVCVIVSVQNHGKVRTCDHVTLAFPLTWGIIEAAGVCSYNDHEG